MKNISFFCMNLVKCGIHRIFKIYTKKNAFGLIIFWLFWILCIQYFSKSFPKYFYTLFIHFVLFKIEVKQFISISKDVVCFGHIPKYLKFCIFQTKWISSFFVILIIDLVDIIFSYTVIQPTLEYVNTMG